MSKHLRSRLVAAALVSALALSACGQEDAASFLAKAKGHLEKSDYSAAIIELRNAREKAPDNAEIRFLLGKALLERGEFDAAEGELRKAEALKYPADAIAPAIARALLAQGEVRKVTKDYGSVQIADAQGRADLSTTLATAYLSQGERDNAKTAADAALAAVPGYPSPFARSCSRSTATSTAR